jgi:excisionase family DNA binding protein
MLKTRAGNVVGTTAPARRATCTVEEAAQRLGVSRNHAYAAVQRGEIPAVRVGRRWLVLNAPFERMLEGEQKKPATNEAA